MLIAEDEDEEDGESRETTNKQIQIGSKKVTTKAKQLTHKNIFD